MELSQLTIERSTSHLYANDNPCGETPLEIFWHVRGQLLAACQRFGRTGPEDGSDLSISFWLVEDQYNDDLYQYLAIHKASAVTSAWLLAIIEVLTMHRGWAVSIADEHGWVLIFADRIVVYGDRFAKCDSVDMILHELANQAAEG